MSIDADPTWVLRDYHSPNLMWLPEREGIARVGLLDFQDAVMGPAAYDLASLLHDARVDVPEALEVALLGRYAQTRRERDSRFDPPAFIRAYSTLAAQRAAKILGIFARLDRRDGKPQYLRHMPRVWGICSGRWRIRRWPRSPAWIAANVPAPKARPLTSSSHSRKILTVGEFADVEPRETRRPAGPWCLPPAAASACAR